MKEEIRKTYYENGNIETERSYVDGVEHGPAKGWYESGELSFEAFKKDGVPHGLVKNYYENGKLQKEIEYNMGIRHGSYKEWYENGMPYVEAQMKNDKLEGIYTGYPKDDGIGAMGAAINGEDVSVVDYLNDSVQKKLNPKTDKNDDFTNTIKFTKELKKYIESHNDTAAIYVYPSKYGVHEEFIHKGQWENKGFTMKISIPLKSPDFNFNGNLNDLIQQLGTKKITQLDEKFYDWLDFLGDGGGSWQIDEIIWEEKLSKEEEKKFNQSEFLSRWLDEGMPSIDDKIVFEKGCIEEIKVTIDDEIIKLVK